MPIRTQIHTSVVLYERQPILEAKYTKLLKPPSFSEDLKFRPSREVDNPLLSRFSKKCFFTNQHARIHVSR